MPTATSQARAWLNDLPGGSFFFAHEVPGRSSVVRTLLSRLAADENSPIHREMQGFYSKLWNEDDEFKPTLSDHVRGALKIAGFGGGGAGLFALNRVGWSLQLPSRYDFAVLGRPPTSPWPRVRFGRRSNERRLGLSAAEVTLLEAVRFFGKLESYPWAESLDMFASGVVHARLGVSERGLRPSAINWVAKGEMNQPTIFHERVDELCRVLATEKKF